MTTLRKLTKNIQIFNNLNVRNCNKNTFFHVLLCTWGKVQPRTGNECP